MLIDATTKIITLREVHFTKMSSIYVDFFWLDEYEKLELCFRNGTFFYGRFLMSTITYYKTIKWTNFVLRA